MHSDLDLFIVGKSSEKSKDGTTKKPLNNLDEILIKAELIKATKALCIPDFDGEGRYLTQFSVEELVESLGTPDDDATNTFTARLLLLLESAAVIGDDQHKFAIRTIIKSYWRDYADHASTFVPVFLANDILRLWRTFCVNYEARTHASTERDVAKRRLKNYKLKHSRLLTCFSALLYMVAWDRKYHSFSEDDAFGMCELSPLSRLEYLKDEACDEKERCAAKDLITRYSTFLDEAGEGGEALTQKLMDSEERDAHFDRATQFGDAMAFALERFGEGSALFRRLLV